MGSRRNSARFSAHRKIFVPGTRLCSAGDLAKHFHLWKSGTRKPEEREEEATGKKGVEGWRKNRARGRDRRNRDTEWARIITGRTIGKSETSPTGPPFCCEVVLTSHGGPPVLVMSYFDEPPRGDYRLTITTVSRDTCNAFIHYHLPLPVLASPIN